MNTQTTTPNPAAPAVDPGGGAHRTRAHVALAVRDLAAAQRFYAALLGTAPTRTEADYARFEVADPPLHLSLNLSAYAQPAGPPAHFGVQVPAPADLLRARLRLEEAGLEATMQQRATCCYAVQDKLWATDPDGHRWEVFVTFQGEVDTHAEPADTTCCPQPAV